jgi:outer membrane biosynthesis protein TonB
VRKVIVVILILLVGSVVREWTLVRSAEVPCLTEFVAPVYPTLARQSGIQGDVHVRVQLDSDCHPAKIDLEDGNALLRGPAENAIKQWRFASCEKSPAPIKNYIPVCSVR